MQLEIAMIAVGGCAKHKPTHSSATRLWFEYRLALAVRLGRDTNINERLLLD
jgi:hypothetical protein